MQGVVTLIRTVEPSATGIKIIYFELLIALKKALDCLIFYQKFKITPPGCLIGYF